MNAALTVSTLLVISAAIGSCSVPPLDRWSRGAIGQNIQTLREIDRDTRDVWKRPPWRETTYPLENGNWVYIHRGRPGCEIHFEVDSRDIMVAWEPVGRGCRYQ